MITLVTRYLSLLLQGAGSHKAIKYTTLVLLVACSSAPQQRVPVFSESVEERVIRELEARVKANDEDFIALNKLSGYYLERLRTTGDPAYLSLALRAAQRSLAVVPAEQNEAGLSALVAAQLESHEFLSARKAAEQFVKLQPTKALPLQLLVDAHLELGDYEQAEAALGRLQAMGVSAGTEIRLARLAFLKGRVSEAEQHMTNALALLREASSPSREAVAWCYWQLGEYAFSRGDYATAEANFKQALEVFPGYYRACGSMARVKVATGDLKAAEDNLRQALKVLPDPVFIALLADVLKLQGREEDSKRELALLEQIERLNTSVGRVYDRQLALIYADHNIYTERAYAWAKEEYSRRKDIYGADTLAWVAFKAGKTDEARTIIEHALRLGTRDARLYYHAGVIASVTDKALARSYLSKALEINSQFDPIQSEECRRLLKEL